LRVEIIYSHNSTVIHAYTYLTAAGSLQVLYEFTPDSHSVHMLVSGIMYVSNKLEVSMAFRFRINRRHGKERRTDGGVQHYRLKCRPTGQHTIRVDTRQNTTMALL